MKRNKMKNEKSSLKAHQDFRLISMCFVETFLKNGTLTQDPGDKYF